MIFNYLFFNIHVEQCDKQRHSAAHFLNKQKHEQTNMIPGRKQLEASSATTGVHLTETKYCDIDTNQFCIVWNTKRDQCPYPALIIKSTFTFQNSPQTSRHVLSRSPTTQTNCMSTSSTCSALTGEERLSWHYLVNDSYSFPLIPK